MKLTYLEIGSRPLRRNRTEDNREGSEEVWLVVVVDAAAKDWVIERSAILPELVFKMLAIFVVWTCLQQQPPYSLSFVFINFLSFLLINCLSFLLVNFWLI